MDSQQGRDLGDMIPGPKFWAISDPTWEVIADHSNPKNAACLISPMVGMSSSEWHDQYIFVVVTSDAAAKPNNIIINHWMVGKDLKDHLVPTLAMVMDTFH